MMSTPDTDPEPISEPPAAPPSPWAALTQREAAVAKYLALGWTCREIAKELDISQKTVDTHRGHALKKLDATGRSCRNNSDLTRLAIREGIITAED